MFLPFGDILAPEIRFVFHASTHNPVRTAVPSSGVKGEKRTAVCCHFHNSGKLLNSEGSEKSQAVFWPVVLFVLAQQQQQTLSVNLVSQV